MVEELETTAFCAYRLRLASRIVLSFCYSQVAKESLHGTVEQLPVLRKHDAGILSAAHFAEL